MDSLPTLNKGIADDKVYQGQRPERLYRGRSR